MTVDALIWGHPDTFDVSSCLKAMDGEGTDASWICPWPCPTESDQRRLATTLRDHRDRLKLVAWIRPRNGHSHLADELARLKAVAVFMHPGQEGYTVTDPGLNDLWEALSALGRPVILATGYPWRSEALQVASVADRYPALPLIMTTGGQINISGLGQYDAWQALTRPNVYALSTGVYRQDFLESVMTRLGAEKLLFASESPRFDFALEVRRIRWANVPAAVKRQVLGENAERWIAKFSR